MNIDKKDLPRLLHLQTFVILREGLEPVEIKNPVASRSANEIFDLIVSASESHNFKSLRRLFDDDERIVMTFVTMDDETGIELDADDIELFAKWLGLIPPPTILQILEIEMEEMKL